MTSHFITRPLMSTNCLSNCQVDKLDCTAFLRPYLECSKQNKVFEKAYFETSMWQISVRFDLPCCDSHISCSTKFLNHTLFEDVKENKKKTSRFIIKLYSTVFSRFLPKKSKYRKMFFLLPIVCLNVQAVQAKSK